jgi:hypothetical protein
MQRGQKVVVRAFPDQLLKRIVWAEGKTYVAVCRPEVYQRALQSGKEPESVMGFPKQDVYADAGAKHTQHTLGEKAMRSIGGNLGALVDR